MATPGLSPKKARQGLEEGSRINKILKEVRAEFGQDASRMVNQELRRPTRPQDPHPNMAANVQRALELFEESRKPKQTRPTPEQLTSSNAAIERLRTPKDRYKSTLARQKAHYNSPEGLAEGMDQMSTIPMAAGLIAGIGLPAAMGVSPLAKALTGASISSGTSLPFYNKDTTPGELAFDAAIGTLPAGRAIAAPALASASLMASQDAQASSPLKMLQMFYRGHNGTPPSEIFATPQKPIAQYYADKRTTQYGGTPTIESMLADPFAGKIYGHSIPLDQHNREIRTTQARKLSPDDIVQKFAAGGLVQDDPNSVNDDLMRDLLQIAAEKYHQFARPVV